MGKVLSSEVALLLSRAPVIQVSTSVQLFPPQPSHPVREAFVFKQHSREPEHEGSHKKMLLVSHREMKCFSQVPSPMSQSHIWSKLDCSWCKQGSVLDSQEVTGQEVN